MRSWVGGSNYTDSPEVVVQRRTGRAWRDFADMSGEIPVTLAYPAPEGGSFFLYAREEVVVEVAALRHAVQERAQLGMVVSRRVEAGGGDHRVELACDHGQANDDDDGRQKNDGENNAACHRWPPAVLHCRAS